MPRLSLLLLPAALVLMTGCITPEADVTVAPGASLGRPSMVYLTFGSTWAANHSVVGVLQQELQRRRITVKRELPEDGTFPEGSLVLHLEYAGDKKTEGEGRIDFLSYLDFKLLSPAGRQLASVHYAGDDLDRLEQKDLVQQVAEELFGSR